MARCDNVNARIGAKRSRLLGAGGLREVLSRPHLAARVELLYQSDYGRAMHAAWAPGRDPLGVADAGMRARLVQETRTIEAVIEGRRQRSLFRAFLLFEDAANLKTVFRGLALSTPLDRVLALTLPTPSLDENGLRALASRPDVPAAVAASRSLAPDFYDALEAALPTRGREGGPLHFDVAIDRAAVAAASRAAKAHAEDAALLAEYLHLRTDLCNAATLIKMDASHAAGEFFLEGGAALPESEYLRIAAIRPASALRQAVVLWARRHVGKGLSGLVEQGGPLSVDTWVLRAAEDRMRREARARPLSLAVPLSFVLDLRAEVRRIRLALLGSGFGLPAAEMVEMLEA